MRFEFATAGRIIFGPGTFKEIGPMAREFGRRALVVTGKRPERSHALRLQLTESGVETVLFSVAGEPDTDRVQAGVQQAKRERCEFVISYGGGSVIDCGKAIAALITNPGQLLDYLEIVGLAKPIPFAPAPFIAIPTTAGTGAEVTRNAVIASTGHGVKVSLRSPLMLPRVALVDPELTINLPRALTASTGMDALTQLIEPFVSPRANPMTDALCMDGLRRAAKSLQNAWENGSHLPSRENMCLASLYGGMALANSGLGAAHGFAGPIGGMFPAPHGAVCAALLPHVMAVNIRALRARASTHPALPRYLALARLLTGNASATPESGADWIAQLCASLQIPSLKSYGIRREQFSILVSKASMSSSMKGNPIALTTAELEEILNLAF